MRSFRTAAVAGASALALTFSTTAVATAQDGDDLLPPENGVTQEENDSIDQGGNDVPVEDYEPTAPEPDEDYEPSLSSDINTGSSLEGDQPAQGPAIFGSSKELDSQPRWAQLLYGASILGGIGSLIGVIVGPIVNFLNHGPQA